MPSATVPPALRGKVFRGREAIDAGLLSPDALRSSAWRRLYRGVYADASIPEGVGLRVSGAALLLPATAAFSGRTAGWVHGAKDLVAVRAPVEVSVPAEVRFGPVAGLRIRRVLLPESDVFRIGGWRCTTPARTALDIARTEPLPDGVAALDVLLRRGIVALDDLRTAVLDQATPRGARRARRAVDLADARAESPPESRVRVLLRLAGLAPVPQFTVRDGGGGFVARVDLAFPDLRIAVEYDGSWHADPRQLGRDRRRLNALVAAGWTVLHLTAADLHDPAALVARVRDLVRRATAG